MLKDHDSSAILAVSDLDRARDFYGNVLGLELAEEGKEDGVLAYKTGATRLIVYRSEYAGTNRANAVVWGVGEDLDAIVAALESKGAQFEHYPGIGRLEGNVHLVGAVARQAESPAGSESATAKNAGGEKLVWIRDPDGNILHINSM
jgi:catechol 2,3-dioxygenase-like lactoylglutathione lyase family enzyme